MNRAFLIIFVPALLVAAGYIIVLRSLGFRPGYSRMVVPVVLLFGAMYWLSRRNTHKIPRDRAADTDQPKQA